MNKSESIKELAGALAKFHATTPRVVKDASNPFFKNKYASLSNIIEVTQKPLADCGLAVIQMPTGENQLTTMLIHESGEYISDTYVMKPTKNDPQGLGSAITYQRRYALGAILNLNIDEDDDGNQASKPPKDEPKNLPELIEGTEDFMKAIEWLTTGGTIERLKKRRSITKEVETSLKEAVKAQSHG